MDPRTFACPAIALFLASGHAQAVWTTNFTSISPGVNGSASGVWREVTNPTSGAGTDSSFAVTLNAMNGGNVMDEDGSALTSRTDESFPWRDLAAGESFVYEGSTIGPLPFPVDLPFANGTSGDFINVETASGSSSMVVIEFGAMITDPMLSFSDIDIGTTLAFTDSFSVVAQTSNLASGANSVSNNMTDAGIPFDEEAAGSLQFSGTFSQLAFTITNNHPLNAEDRTGFVVTTESEPMQIPEPGTTALVLGGLLLVGRRRR